MDTVEVELWQRRQLRLCLGRAVVSLDCLGRGPQTHHIALHRPLDKKGQGGEEVGTLEVLCEAKEAARCQLQLHRLAASGLPNVGGTASIFSVYGVSGRCHRCTEPANVTPPHWSPHALGSPLVWQDAMPDLLQKAETFLEICSDHRGGDEKRSSGGPRHGSQSSYRSREACRPALRCRCVARVGLLVRSEANGPSSRPQQRASWLKGSQSTEPSRRGGPSAGSRVPWRWGGPTACPRPSPKRKSSSLPRIFVNI